ncbi:MAG: carboxymuconolactone decarboxylase family protein [Gammaproteobacteria bacterium]|nr:carboxymuconolactone decarboxylase family protein [Gammaproteobacteria bacterium]
MSHLNPLPRTANPELEEEFALLERILGFVPNSVLTMQRRPKIVKGFATLTRSVMDPEGEVELGFKRLLAHMASAAAGCQYCAAHSIIAARIHGISDEKVEALWNYEHSPLYSEAERVALEFARCSGAVPNAVTPELFERLRAHWNEKQIVEMLGVVALYGFLNRWNDSMATDLEAPALATGERFLAKHGWNAGKHSGRGRKATSGS